LTGICGYGAEVAEFSSKAALQGVTGQGSGARTRFKSKC
jgi:hypothetical protein